MESIISLFHIDWKIIIAQVINFGVVFTVLYIFALKPLAKLMDERAEKIGKGVNDAKTNAAILEKTTAEYDKALANARKEANNIFQEGKREAEKEKTQILEQAKKEVDSMIANGKKTLEAEKSKMVDEARSEIVALAMAATEKLIGEKSGKDLENI